MKNMLVMLIYINSLPTHFPKMNLNFVFDIAIFMIVIINIVNTNTYIL